MGAALQRSIDIAAPPEAVWDLVSDLPQMGRFSPENCGGRWKSGSGPEVGAVFQGTNRQGRRKWSTVATVTRSEPGVAFEFSVRAVGQAVAEWRYAITPTATGCTLTESWEDRRNPVLKATVGYVTGVKEREGFTAKSIQQTLERVKAVAEGEPSGAGRPA